MALVDGSKPPADFLADPTAVRSLPRPQQIEVRYQARRLLAELERLEPEPSVLTTPAPQPRRLSMKEAAAYVGWTYRTFRTKWPKVLGLAAAHFADGGRRHFFLSSKLDEYLEQRGTLKGPAARRGIGR